MKARKTLTDPYEKEVLAYDLDKVTIYMKKHSDSIFFGGKNTITIASIKDAVMIVLSEEKYNQLKKILSEA